MAGQISNKVSVGTLGGSAATVVTWILTQYVPAFHSGLPPALGALLPGVLGAAGYFGGGYLARHYPAEDEVVKAVLSIIEQQQKSGAAAKAG